MQQNALPLAWNASYGVDDYIVDECNTSALEAVLHPDKWQTAVLILEGDRQSGKTHLARIFTTRHMVLPIDGEQAAADVLHGQGSMAVIDDIDQKLANRVLQAETVFHLVNDVMQRKARLLLTATSAYGGWTNLPDLLSRLAVMQTITIGNPDERVVKATLQKLFLDRGLMVDDKVLDFLTMRMERSFHAITKLVEQLDRLALENARKITIPLIQSTGLFD